MLQSERVGPTRQVRLASPDVASAIEAISRIAPRRAVRTLRQAQTGSPLERARTCYDHLAGRLGVALTDALLARAALVNRDGGFDVTPAGSTRRRLLRPRLAQMRRRVHRLQPG